MLGWKTTWRCCRGLGAQIMRQGKTRSQFFSFFVKFKFVKNLNFLITCIFFAKLVRPFSILGWKLIILEKTRISPRGQLSKWLVLGNIKDCQYYMYLSTYLVREKKSIDHFSVIKYLLGLILLIKILGFWTELPFVTTFGKNVTFCTPNSFGNSISINPPIDPLKAMANKFKKKVFIFYWKSKYP